MAFAGGGIPPGVGKAILAKSAYREAICGQNVSSARNAASTHYGATGMSHPRLGGALNWGRGLQTAPERNL